MVLTNPVVVSVVIMLALCLMNLNVMIAILVAAIVAGITAGISIPETMGIMINGMGGNSETALAYVLLGAFAVAINKTGVATIVCRKITSIVKGRKMLLLFILLIISILSQNLVPVHIAFIPILIPPLLALFNKMKIDRRQVACVLAFGLKAPYITIPFGYGLIFHGIITDAMAKNGIMIDKATIPHYVWILGVGMIIGLLFAVFIAFNKPREYEDRPIIGIDPSVSADEGINGLTSKHWLTILAIVVAFVVQLWSSSLPLGALAALVIMVLTRALTMKDLEDVCDGGIKIMGMIAFIMLIAAGYGDVLRETHSVENLVNSVVGLVGGSKFWGAMLMLGVGLLVDMGIGTSFGTVPIIATIYCPLATQLGFSSGALVCLLAAAAALGDAGSPASDTTLGPTAGLNADGQHNHIWDTCVPTFLVYNIPLFIAAMIGAVVLF